MRSFGKQNLVLGKIKDFFGHHSQDVESIFALLLRGHSVSTYVRNEGLPGGAPFKFNDADQCRVKFG
jgi:hypothetical protein